jgi:phosphate-selective porin OprO/OprP
MTFLPWYRDQGQKLFHLGLSYSHQFRDEEDEDAKKRLRARPESRITDERLVDTGKLSIKVTDLIGTEMAVTHGPFSLQGECFYNLTESDAEGDPDFWGHYLYVSYFLTGENRGYNKSKGVFSGIKPKNSFRPLQGKWGALELALRYSYLDLNDEGIKGGKERNITTGLNWYLNSKTRFMLNYTRARVEDRGKPAIDDGKADILQARFQWCF